MSGLGSVLRLASLWEDELRSKGSDASLCWVFWSFCWSRLLLSILCLAVTQLAGFSGPVSQAQSGPVRPVQPVTSGGPDPIPVMIPVLWGY